MSFIKIEMINPNIFKKIIEMSVPKKIYRAHIRDERGIKKIWDKYFYEKENAIDWLYKEYYRLVEDTILETRYHLLQGEESLANKFNEIVINRILSKAEKIKMVYDDILVDLLNKEKSVAVMMLVYFSIREINIEKIE